MVKTHGGVHDESYSLARRVAGVDKVVTQVVADNILFRNELINKQVGPILRRVEALEQQVAKLAHDVEHVPAAERQVVLSGFVTEVREIAQGMSKRIRILEVCIQGIESKLRLRRKDDPEKVIEALDAPDAVAMPTPPPTRQPSFVAEAEPRRRWWRRNRDEDDES